MGKKKLVVCKYCGAVVESNRLEHLLKKHPEVEIQREEKLSNHFQRR